MLKEKERESIVYCVIFYTLLFFVSTDFFLVVVDVVS